MKHIKNIFAYLITWIILLIGLFCLISFFHFHNSSPTSPFGFIWIFGSVLIFHPVYDYWLKVAKRFLNIKD